MNYLVFLSLGVSLQRLQLDKDFVETDKVCPIANPKRLLFVVHWQLNLSLIGQFSLSELYFESSLVNRFQESRPKNPMHLHSSPNDEICLSISDLAAINPIELFHLRNLWIPWEGIGSK